MTAKKQTVLKDLKQLEKLNRHRVDIIAMQIYAVVFKGGKEKAFEPKAKTVVHQVWSIDKLSVRQQQGWHLLCKDIDSAYGRSGSVAGGYGEFYDKGERTYLPRAYVNDAQGRLEDLERRFLDRREKALLRDLLRNAAQEGHELKLEHIGLVRSGYSGTDTARAAGVTHVQVLLDRLATFYGF